MHHDATAPGPRCDGCGRLFDTAIDPIAYRWRLAGAGANRRDCAGSAARNPEAAPRDGTRNGNHAATFRNHAATFFHSCCYVSLKNPMIPGCFGRPLIYPDLPGTGGSGDRGGSGAATAVPTDPARCETWPCRPTRRRLERATTAAVRRSGFGARGATRSGCASGATKPTPPRQTAHPPHSM